MKKPTGTVKKQTVVYLVEEWWYSSYTLFAAYFDEEIAKQHVAKLRTESRNPTIRRIGVRSQLQFGKTRHTSKTYRSCSNRTARG